MGREIKFRAWHKTEKLMCKVRTLTDEGAFLVGVKSGEEQIIIDLRMIIPADPEGRFCEHQEFELMQFTELKDKNGKEIYEGDVVRTDEAGWIGRVSYSRDCFMVEDNKGGFSYSCNWEKFEIIGNIYENESLNQ